MYTRNEPHGYNTSPYEIGWDNPATLIEVTYISGSTSGMGCAVYRLKILKGKKWPPEKEICSAIYEHCNKWLSWVEFGEHGDAYARIYG